MNKNTLRTNFLCLKISQGLWQLNCYTDKDIALDLSCIVSLFLFKIIFISFDRKNKIILVLLVVNQSITDKLLYQIKVGLHYALKHLTKFGIKTSLSEKELTMT